MRLANVSLLLSLIVSASALHIPFERRSLGPTPIRLNKRAGNQPSTSDPYYFENLSDDVYVGTITIDGVPFQVQLDTGSSDLWIDSTGLTFPSATDTKVIGEITYLDKTEAKGPILLGSVKFGNWTAPKQAFISAVGTDATNLGDKGLLGVGPPSSSNVANVLSHTSYNGNSFLDNVFDAYPDDPDVITFLLSRSETTGTTSGGHFTIGTVVPGYEDILSTTTFDVTGKDSWITAIDGVVVNGTSYSGKSQYLKGEKISVILDTGTAQAITTKTYVDALYSKIPGSKWRDDQSTYVFACESVVNFSMVFGKEIIFLHPIDLAFPLEASSDGTVTCAGTFSVDDKAGVDFLLGDSFLRNAYSLFYFGEWATSGTGTPYMQVLGITDPHQAFSEFSSLNAQRIQDFTQHHSNSNSDSSHSSSDGAVSGAVSADGSSGSADLSGLNRNSYIIMGMVGVVVALLLANLVVALRKNHGYKQIGAGSAPPAHFGNTSYSMPYKDLDH